MLGLMKLANALRRAFDRFAATVDTVGVVAIFASLTGIVLYAWDKWTPKSCHNIPIRAVDLQMTFSGRRFSVLMKKLEGSGCDSVFLDGLLVWDIAFPVLYSLTLAAVFIWAENHRRYLPSGTSTGADVPKRNHVFLLLPFVAAILDIAFENFPLWIAGHFGATGTTGSALVIISSLAASLKWTLIVIAILTILAELLHDARGLIIKRVRYGIVAVLIGALPLLMIPQGQDILQRTVEGDNPFLPIVLGMAAITFGGYVVWYCSRRLVQLDFGRDTKTSAEWYRYYGEVIPRILGVATIVLGAAAYARTGSAFLVFAGVAFGGFALSTIINKNKTSSNFVRRIGRVFVRGYLRHVKDYDKDVGHAAIAVLLILIALSVTIWQALKPRQRDIDLQLLRIVAYVLLVVAWGFYLYIDKRRDRAIERLRKYRFKDFGVEGPVSSIDPDHLTRTIKIALVIGMVASVGAVAVFTWWSVPAARAVGTLVVLSMSVASVVFYGSIATWIHERHGIPIVPIALLMAAVFSIWNDSHVVHRVTGDQSQIGLRRDIPTQYARWEADTVGRNTNTVVLVAAAGGGLRAAYWTAVSLGVLQDRITNFNRNVFAISSVSGGSVGASVYASLVRDASRGKADCVKGESAQQPVFANCMRRFMEDDYLSPVLAKMVAPDFVQSFLPFPWSQLDRSSALEGSWESSYSKLTGDSTLSHRFLALYDSTQPAAVPALFLNTTHVESGRRYIMASLTRGDSSQPFRESHRNMHDSEDLLRLLESDLKLSTAAHNSARFTYVSPPGRIQRNDTLEFGHVVDGGYFENSGLATLREILEALPAGRSKAIVLYLCNDPLPCNAQVDSMSAPIQPRSAVSEWLGPIRAILSTREARGSLSRADVADLSNVKFFQLNVCDALTAGDTTDVKQFNPVLPSEASEERARDRVISPPLGWLLSKVARDWMDKSLTPGPSRCRISNAAVIDSIRFLVRPSTAQH
jgi:hypothetical protein